MLRIRLVVSTVVAAALATATPALASVAGEQQAGQALAQQVQSGKRACDSLSAEDLDHIGEFVMGRMIGSTAVHEAMNARMTAVMGATAESRMHQVLGARFVGCTTGSGAGGAMMGGGGPGSMMSSGSGSQMMGDTRDWSWMMGGRWQQMSTADWHAVQQRLLGTATTRSANGGGLSTLGVVLIALGAAVATGLLVLLAVRRSGTAPTPGGRQSA